MNTLVWTQIITLSRPCRDRSVDLAGRQCHCVMMQNICMSAVYESPNLMYKRQIKDVTL